SRTRMSCCGPERRGSSQPSTKFEARNPKPIRMTKSKNPIQPPRYRSEPYGFDHLSFEFLACFGFRASNLRFAAILFLLLAGSPVYAQRNLTDIPDPDPELERRSFEVADGFEVNLFAADPLIAKPIQMNWDAAGRLWLVSSELYPQIPPGQTANDKVLI